ncbi:MAG: hypothetical protein R2764_01555 [Bacteroidales bacterium]
MTRRHVKRLGIAIVSWLLAIIICYATGWIYERWCELALGIAIILIIGYPVLISRLNKD